MLHRSRLGTCASTPATLTWLPAPTMPLRVHSAAGTAPECAHRQISAHLRAMAAACAHALDRGSRRCIATKDALITGAGRPVKSPGGASSGGHAACDDPGIRGSGAMTPIVCVDVMRRTLAPAIRGVVSETSALRGNSVEIASAAVTGVTLGMKGSSARCHRRDASGHLPSSQSGTQSRRFAYDLDQRGV